MTCPKDGCGAAIRAQVDPEMMTLVGYMNEPGHNHDDNCRKRGYVCAAGHEFVLSKQMRCKADGCGWVGKSQCWCHESPKVQEWPDVPEDWAPRWHHLLTPRP